MHVSFVNEWRNWGSKVQVTGSPAGCKSKPIWIKSPKKIIPITKYKNILGHYTQKVWINRIYVGLMKAAFFFLVKIQKTLKKREEKTDFKDQLPLQLIIKICQSKTWLITIYLKFFLSLGSRELFLPHFPLNSDPFPSVSFSLLVPEVLVFPGILSSAFFSLLLPSLGDIIHIMVSAIIQCLSSVQSEPKSSRYICPKLYCI